MILFVTVPLLFSIAAGFPFPVDTQEDLRNFNSLGGVNSINGINSVNNFHGLMCQDTNEIACSTLNVESRCETTCSGYRVCFKACPSGAAMPGEQNLICICRDGLVRNYQGFCVPRQACFGIQQQFFGRFGQRPWEATRSWGVTRPWEVTRPWAATRSFDTSHVTPRMTSFETASSQVETENEHPTVQTVEPQNPLLAERKRQARTLAAKKRS